MRQSLSSTVLTTFSRSSSVVFDLSLNGRLISVDSVEADSRTKLSLLPLLLLLVLLLFLLTDAKSVVTMRFELEFLSKLDLSAVSSLNANESVVEANLFRAVLLLSICISFSMRNILAYSGLLSA